MGYANRVITRQFPELVEDGEKCWVTIRNPRILSPSELSTEDIKVSKDTEGGEVVVDEATTKATYRIGAKLIVGMRVPDPTAPIDLDDDGYPLPGPTVMLATRPGPDDVAKLPLEIITWLGDEIGKINPQQPPADGTSKTS